MIKIIARWYHSFKERKEQRHLALIKKWADINQKCLDANKSFQNLLDGTRYINEHLKSEWTSNYHTLYASIEKNRKQRKYHTEQVQIFEERFLRFNDYCRDCNHRFVIREKEVCKRLFDNIEGRALDEQQRTCIVKDEINNIVVAGAGSGKTTTIVGKVKYLLERLSYHPKELLVLSFTNNSASEMKERIKKEAGKDLDVMTFHKLGKEIIATVEGKQPSLTNIPLASFINQQLSEETKNRCYLNELNSFFLYHFNQYKSPFEFETIEDYQKNLKSNGNLTFKGERVKSQEEMEIANFFYVNQIEYEYEAKYKFDVATREHSQYRPDFYLPEYDIYLEHFGIDREGNVPPFFKGEDGKSAKQIYNEGIKWKRKQHARNKTTLIETYSYEKLEGTLVENLKEKLIEHGVVLKPMDSDELWETLKQNISDNSSFIDLVETFIQHCKANSFSIADLKTKNMQLCSKYLQKRNAMFLSIVEPIYNQYIKRLREANEIDFNDMINKATDYINQGKFETAYRYIIVDEYQDISLPRYKLIKAIKDQVNAKLFCVGDDWQSIYRFAGSDLSFFTHFEKYFGHAEKSYIETTYRFPMDVINLSSNFILKNPNQIKKNLKSTNPDKSRAFELVYGTEKTLIRELKKRLDSLPSKSNVLFLGRYRTDINNYLDYHLKLQNSSLQYSMRKDLKIEFMTIHGSKGLQADYVFILNNLKDKHGFPSNITDDPVLGLVLQEEEDYPYAEERRLFYVALTRAKKFVFLMVEKTNKSVFIRNRKGLRNLRQ